MSKKQVKNYLRLRDPTSHLEFGRLVAEQDDELAQYYVRPEKYVDRAVSFEDPGIFYLGPKGVGKSAVLKMVELRRSSDQGRIIKIAPDDLAFSALANVETSNPLFKDPGKNTWLFKSLWDYVLALEICKKEYPEEGGILRFLTSIVQGSHEKEARRLVALSTESGDSPTLTTRILQLVKEVQIAADLPGAKVSGTVALDHSSHAHQQTEQVQFLALVHRVAKRIGDSLRHQYHVLIDDLDKYWYDSPTHNSVIAALFQSLRHFARPSSIKCVVALRDNIYREIPLQDRDKFADLIVRVNWDADAVKEMIETRVVYRLQVSRAEIWGGLFPANGFSLLWNHCSGQPREVIRLAGLCAEQAQHNGHQGISEDDMSQAIAKFSEERLIEISDEIRHKYPFLHLVAKRLAGGPKEFPLQIIEELCVQLAMDVLDKKPGSEKYSWAGGYEDNPISFAHILMEAGVLWFKPSRTAEARAFNYDEHMDVGRDSWFAVHPMIAPGLGCQGA